MSKSYSGTALLDHCEDLRELMELVGVSCPSLSGLEIRSDYLTHLKCREKLAQEVEFMKGSEARDGFQRLDALAAVEITAAALQASYERFGDSERYMEQQRVYLAACEGLRQVQSEVRNNREIKEKFDLFCGDQVRTSSRVEALNRRLRGFTAAKRRVTERQLRLMHLHHNTTAFTRDAKRAGKSPWQWLGLDVAGLESGFVGVLAAANDDASWPSPWALKS